MDREQEVPDDPDFSVAPVAGQGPEPSRGSRRRTALAMVLVALIAGGAGAGLGVALSPGLKGCRTCAVAPARHRDFPPTGPNSLAAVVEAVEPSVVDISTTLVVGGAAAGTGIVLSPDGAVLTNNHVVLEAATITVATAHGTLPAHVVGVDPAKDVAVLQIDGLKAKLTSAHLGASSRLQVGDSVVALGNAFGSGTETPATGVVTAEGRSIDASGDLTPTLEPLTGLLETDADIQEGDSGGPLVDASGLVVGMNTAMATEDGGDATVGFAIPIDQAREIAGEIRRGAKSSALVFGRSAFLGVDFAPTGSIDATARAVIAGLVHAGPAEHAGLSSGDVITAFAGQPVSSATALGRLLARERPGQAVRVVYEDGSGQQHQATIVLGATVK